MERDFAAGRLLYRSAFSEGSEGDVSFSRLGGTSDEDRRRAIAAEEEEEDEEEAEEKLRWDQTELENNTRE